MFLKTLIRNSTPSDTWSSWRSCYYRWFWSNERLVRRRFAESQGYRLDLGNPVTFNEKLQWLKLFWHDARAAQCADKYALRLYLETAVGGDYLVPLAACYTNTDDFDVSALPNSFVLKPAHASQKILICRQRDCIDVSPVKRKISAWLRYNHYWTTREWVYRHMTPRVLVEPYLCDSAGNPPCDYKVFCFHGEPHFIQVDLGRFRCHRRNIYDMQWRLLDFEIKYPRDIAADVVRPPVKTMAGLCRELAKPFPHVRIDFYFNRSRLMIGEMTFFHGGGFERFVPEEWGRRFGALIDLSSIECMRSR